MNTAMKTIEIRWNDGYGFNRLHVVDPESTDVAPVKKESKRTLETHKALKEVERERQAAHVAVDKADEINRAAARQAAIEGLAVKPKELRKRAAADRERAAELDLEWEGAVAKMQTRRFKYLEVIEHHTPALRAEAKAALDSAILSVASSSQIALRAEGAMLGALEILGALASGDFTPRALVAKSREVGEGGAPTVYLSVARENLGKAVGYASEILQDVKGAEKVEKLVEIADESPDIDDEPDEDDDAAEALDPDLYDVDGDDEVAS